jgi:hypothetical protein
LKSSPSSAAVTEISPSAIISNEDSSTIINSVGGVTAQGAEGPIQRPREDSRSAFLQSIQTANQKATLRPVQQQQQQHADDSNTSTGTGSSGSSGVSLADELGLAMAARKSGQASTLAIADRRRRGSAAPSDPSEATDHPTPRSSQNAAAAAPRVPIFPPPAPLPSHKRGGDAAAIISSTRESGLGPIRSDDDGDDEGDESDGWSD